MTSRISKQNIILPEFGKKQISIKKFSWKIKSSKLFIIYLPCAKQKPYYLSSTHTYFKQKLKEFLPQNWDTLILICTISEVIGIVPEDLEDVIFNKKNGNYQKYNYEHYPDPNENDIDNTRRWLIKFIQDHDQKEHYAYLTSKTFREITDNIIQLRIYPKDYKPSSALFEFRKAINIQAFCKVIENNYLKILKKRFFSWKKRKRQAYVLLREFWNISNFNISDIKLKLPNIKNPSALVSKLCREGRYQRGIFFEKINNSTYQIMPVIRRNFGQI